MLTLIHFLILCYHLNTRAISRIKHCEWEDQKSAEPNEQCIALSITVTTLTMCVSKWSEQSCVGYFAGAQSPWKASAAVERLNFKCQYVVHAGETEMRERSCINLAATTAAHWHSGFSPNMSMHNTFSEFKYSMLKQFAFLISMSPYSKALEIYFLNQTLRSHEHKILEE